MTYKYNISGMSCNGCRSKVELTLSRLDNVEKAEVTLNPPEAIITSNVKIPIETFQKALSAAGKYTITSEENPATPPSNSQEPHLTQKPVKNGSYYCPMHCEGDTTYDKPGDCPVCGMDLVAVNKDDITDESFLKLKKKFIIACIFTIPVFILSMGGMWHNNPLNSIISTSLSDWLQFILTIPVFFYSGWIFFKRAWTSIKTWNLNMFTLIGIGSGAAFIYSLIALLFPSIFPPELKAHLYFEAVAVILTLVLLGQMLEARANGKTNSAIKKLLSFTPSTATIVLSGKDYIIDINEIKKGDILRVKPGEKIAVDGTILQGNGTIDESMITGEPIPIDKTIGDKVSSGTINTNGTFTMKAEKIGKETLLSQIIEMVENASRSKAPIQKMADTVSAFFVPAVVIIAIITFFIWIFVGGEHAYIFAISNALAVLIIACPCALGLATPISIMVGVGKGAENGILIKNAEALEVMDRVNILLLDKTGTITEGQPTVEAVYPLNDFDINMILDNAAAINRNSEHPLAVAIVDYAQQNNAKTLQSENFINIPGEGVKATIDGNIVILGNIALLNHENIQLSHDIEANASREQMQGKTVSFLAINNKLTAYIVISDAIKESSREAIKKLMAMNIQVVMLTGDNLRTAENVSKELGLSGFIAECLPGDKLNEIKRLQSEGNIVAMAGDGINDSPALMAANIGIAMGTGTDIAIESSEITLVKGNLNGIVKAKQLSHATMRNIKENLFFAFIYNILGITIASGLFYPIFGWLLSPMIAAAAMSFSSVSVITNALRLKRL